MYAKTVSRQSALAAVTAAGLVAALAGLASTRAVAQSPPVKIGELNSYSRMAAFAGPYRNGMQLAQDEINAKGGLLGGRKLEIVFRDDGATPGDAVRVAEELLTRENVSFLVGTFLSNVGLAVADFANQKKVLFLATEPLTDAITMAQGNKYTYRVRPSTFMQTKMLVDAVKAKGVKKWAIVAPNYEYGQSAAANFKKLIKIATPDAEIVGEQFPALGKIDAGATVAALEQTKPDGIFNVLFGADLTVFVREGNTRGLFEKRTVASLLTGEPEYILPLGEETPEGWIVTGYPWEQITEPEHKAFIDRLPGQVRRRAAAGLAARLRRRLHDEGRAREGRLDRYRQAARSPAGRQVQHHRRSRDDARARSSVDARGLGRRDHQAGQDRHHEELEVRGRREVPVPRSRGEGRAQGVDVIPGLVPAHPRVGERRARGTMRSR